MTTPRLAVVGALYSGGERGLTADILCARALGFAPVPICTQITAAGGGRVTDVTDVPTDTVAAQLDHTFSTGAVAGVKLGILASHHTAAVVLEACEAFGVPIVLDFVASGPSGETILSAKGIDAVAERLGVPALVTMSRADAELVTGGEISSLDDAQVAAQRVTNRGARVAVIRCGPLPYRFYDAAEDPGSQSAITGATAFDLAFDGEDFSLFEAPLLPDPMPAGASSAFSIAALASLIAGDTPDEALQKAKRFATESIRHATPGSAEVPLLNPFWETTV